MSDYASRTIEKLAVNEVERYFQYSKIVSTFIQDGDREPFFDGHLYLYAAGGRDNEHYTGRIAVQVKGENLGQFTNGVYSYPIEMTALKAYLHEGIAYFVVQEVKQKKKLYYRLLTPVELRTLVRKKDGQKTVNVRLKQAYDRDLKKMEVALLQFDMDCKKQVSYAEAPTFDFKEWEKLGIHKFSIDLTVLDKKTSFLQEVTTKPIFLYADMPGGAKIPLGDGPANIALMREVEQPVIVGKRKFYNKVKTTMQNGMLTMQVGACFTITLDPSRKNKKVSMSIKRGAKILKEVINEAEFLLALKEKKVIHIGALTLPIPFPDDNEVTKGIEEYLVAWHKLDEVLDKMHCNKDLDMSMVKKADEKTIEIIIDVIGEGNVRSLKDVTSGINNIHLANLNLWFLIYKDDEGKHIIKNFFDHSVGYKAEYKYPEGLLKESIYSWFDRQKLLDCDNFPYCDVIPSYEELKNENPHIYERGNFFLLELIAAYDRTEDEVKKKVMYEAALKINEWLTNGDAPESRIVHLLNKYQILKRSPGLSEEQKDELKKIQLENANDEQIAYAASLLLEDRPSIEYYWNRIDKDTQKEYKEKMPIYKFHELSDTGTYTVPVIDK